MVVNPLQVGISLAHHYVSKSGLGEVETTANRGQEKGRPCSKPTFSFTLCSSPGALLCATWLPSLGPPMQ
jgi:hypothetical protein